MKFAVVGAIVLVVIIALLLKREREAKAGAILAKESGGGPAAEDFAGQMQALRAEFAQHTGQRRPESFARGAARGRAYTQATDAYQASLQSRYDAWAAETARELAKVDPDDEDAFRRKLDDRLAVGLLLLKKLGWFN